MATIFKRIINIFKSVSKPTFEYIYGKSKPIEEVSLQDMQKYPIWIFDYDGEAIEGQDETWQKPIINTCDVTVDLLEAYILLSSLNKKQCISANLDIDHLILSDINIWDDTQNNWILIEECKDIDITTLILTSVPSIKGIENMEFKFDEKKKAFQTINENVSTL